MIQKDKDKKRDRFFIFLEICTRTGGKVYLNTSGMFVLGQADLKRKVHDLIFVKRVAFANNGYL